MRKCKLCQSSDLRPRQQVCDECRAYNCENCGKDMMRTPKEIKGNKRFCSVKCAQSSPATKKKIEDKNKELYGGTGFQAINKWEDKTEEEKSAQINKMREGLKEYVSDEDNVKAMRKKVAATNLERYGAKSPLSGESSVRKLAEDNRDMKEIHRKAQITKSAWSQSKRDDVHSRISATNKETWDNTDEETKLARANKISKARAEFFEKETFEERKARRALIAEGQRKWWESLTNEEKEEVNNRRMDNFNSPNSIFPVISNVNRRWASELSEFTNREFDFEFRLNNMSYDLFCGDLLVDINPTVSHNSDVSFSHTVGWCDKENCEKHPPIAKDYHIGRHRNAKAAGLDWVFVYDYYNRAEVSKVIGKKLGIYDEYKSSTLSVNNLSNNEAKSLIDSHSIDNIPNTSEHYLSVSDDGSIVLCLGITINDDEMIIDNYFIDYNYDVYSLFSFAIDELIARHSPSTIMFYSNTNISEIIPLESLEFTPTGKTSERIRRVNIKNGMTIDEEVDLKLNEDIVCVYESHNEEYRRNIND